MSEGEGNGARLQPTKEELLHAIAKAVCDVAKGLMVGQHGFMSPCSRCARLVIAINNHEDSIPNEREAELLDQLDFMTKERDSALAAMRHIFFCMCPDKDICVPHGAGSDRIDQCAVHEHGTRLVSLPTGDQES